MLYGCSPFVYGYLPKPEKPLDEREEVAVLDKNDSIPGNTVRLGMVCVEDGGMTSEKKGSYENVLALAQKYARKGGGNAIRINEHLFPDDRSSAHWIKADVLKIMPTDTPDAPALVAAADVSVPAELSVTGKLLPFRIAIQGGFGYYMPPFQSDGSEVMERHVKHLRWGGVYGADVVYFFGGEYGAGLKFQNLHLGNKMRIIASIDGGPEQKGFLADRIDISYIGPVCSYRKVDARRKGMLYSAIGLGYVGYYDNAILIDPFKLKTWTLGDVFEVGYDAFISKHLALGASASLVTGKTRTVNKIDKDGKRDVIVLESKDALGFAHLSLSAGLRYYL